MQLPATHWALEHWVVAAPAGHAAHAAPHWSALALQVMPQVAAEQVAVPRGSAGHGLQRVPHEVRASLRAQVVPQRWYPPAHSHSCVEVLQVSLEVQSSAASQPTWHCPPTTSHQLPRSHPCVRQLRSPASIESGLGPASDCDISGQPANSTSSNAGASVFMGAGYSPRGGLESRLAHRTSRLVGRVPCPPCIRPRRDRGHRRGVGSLREGGQVQHRRGQLE